MTCRSIRAVALRAALAAGLVLGGAAAAQDKEFTGKVHRVRDGDTIVVIDQDQHHNEVRLNGIDAPEKGSKTRPGQPFADRSREALNEKLQGQQVRIVWRKYDRYKRIVGTVYLGEADMNLGQVQAGMAWVFTEYAKEIRDDLRPVYLGAEAQAKEQGLGLWRDGAPEAPWAYRDRLKRAADTPDADD